MRADLPIYLAAEGPKNVSLSAEIADGWLPMFYAPRVDGFYRDALAEGFAAARRAAHGRRRSRSRASCRSIIADDVEAAADMYRPMLALYIGGMGAREVNFHNNVFARMGYEGEAKLIQDLYLDGKKDEAAAAVPTPARRRRRARRPSEKIRDDLEMWRESAVTTMVVSGPTEQLRNIAELVLG